MDKGINKKEENMLERIRPERHISAMMTLATIRFIKEECNKSAHCKDCRFYDRDSYEYSCCIHQDEYSDPSDWDEYDLTERIYK